MKIDKNTIFSFVATPIFILISILFFYSGTYRFELNLDEYQELRTILREIECSEENGRIIFFHTDHSSSLWSYVDPDNWPDCGKILHETNAIIGKPVSFWVGSKEVVQMVFDERVYFSLQDYVEQHKLKNYKHASFLLFLAIANISYLIYRKLKK